MLALRDGRDAFLAAFAIRSDSAAGLHARRDVLVLRLRGEELLPSGRLGQRP